MRQSWQIDAGRNEVAGTRSVYYYDGDDLVAVSDGFGSWREAYAHGPTGLFWKRGILDGTGSRWYHADRLGSVKILSDVNVNVTDTYNYDPFGNITNQTDPTHNPFRYVGQLGYYRRNVLATPSPPEYGRGQDRLMLLGARWYDPVIGRFLTQDPIGYAGGMNLYAYVGAIPTALVDPAGTGLQESFQDLLAPFSWYAGARKLDECEKQMLDYALALLSYGLAQTKKNDPAVRQLGPIVRAWYRLSATGYGNVRVAPFSCETLGRWVPTGFGGTPALNPDLFPAPSFNARTPRVGPSCASWQRCLPQGPPLLLANTMAHEVCHSLGRARKVPGCVTSGVPVNTSQAHHTMWERLPNG